MKNMNAIGLDQEKSQKLAADLNNLLANYHILYKYKRISLEY